MLLFLHLFLFKLIKFLHLLDMNLHINVITIMLIGFNFLLFAECLFSMRVVETLQKLFNNIYLYYNTWLLSVIEALGTAGCSNLSFVYVFSYFCLRC